MKWLKSTYVVTNNIVHVFVYECMCCGCGCTCTGMCEANLLQRKGIDLQQPHALPYWFGVCAWKWEWRRSPRPSLQAEPAADRLKSVPHFGHMEKQGCGKCITLTSYNNSCKHTTSISCNSMVKSLAKVVQHCPTPS